jgi:23S rRNA (cytidine1920-2'-O)/16S rRNA (cytidine1409-2'-O)-methyltransferase
MRTATKAGLTRADVLLVRSGLARSRTEAQRLIEAGQVAVANDAGKAKSSPTTLKPSTPLDDSASFELVGDPERYASRGALKLRHALQRFGIDAGNRVCLDAGQSTGGFTDCLLRANAKTVVGIDVGHGQLSESLRNDERVICIERMNLRDATLASVLETIRAGAPTCDLDTAAAIDSNNGFELISVDLSFISVRKVLPSLARMLAKGGDMVVLVKPQFELGPGAVNKHGVVRNPNATEFLQKQFADQQRATDGLTLCAWITSPITGGDGNQEHLIHLKPI